MKKEILLVVIVAVVAVVALGISLLVASRPPPLQFTPRKIVTNGHGEAGYIPTEFHQNTSPVLCFINQKWFS